MSFDIVPGTEPYYERTDLQTAIQIATEMIEEWDYAEDPHGYCHTRPTLIRLVEAVRDQEAVIRRSGAAISRVLTYCQDALAIFLEQGIDSPPAVGVADVLQMLGDQE